MDIIPFHENQSEFTANLEFAVVQVKRGKLIVVPTETVYGLAADAENGQAIAKVFEAKKRPSFNPLIAHVADKEMAGSVGKVDLVLDHLMDHFWPGPLTFVLDQLSNSKIHQLGCAGLDTIAVRCPAGPVGKLISALGRPIFAPSANKSGRVSPTSALHSAEEFSDIDGTILDGGRCSDGIESTIIRILEHEIVILRPGSIGQEQLQKISNMPVRTHQPDGEIFAPGMMQSHYAPNAIVFLNCTSAKPGSAVLNFGSDIISNNSTVALNLSEEGDLVKAASNLYSHIRRLDASGAELICVAPIPETGLGIAINDRLKRAAAPRSQEE